jgi:hypothetical protein
MAMGHRSFPIVQRVDPVLLPADQNTIITMNLRRVPRASANFPPPAYMNA